jgi:hypothetical protein
VALKAGCVGSLCFSCFPLALQYLDLGKFTQSWNFRSENYNYLGKIIETLMLKAAAFIIYFISN